MFTCTLRKGGLRRAAVVALCGVILAGAAAGVGAARSGMQAVETAAQTAGKQQITGAQDVAVFLQGYGVQADPSTATVNEVRVPRKWDADFEAFNEVIRESGLDLSRIKNKKADKWMLQVPSRSTEQQKCWAVVLVYKKEPRGAYLLQKPSGEVLPLKEAADTSLALTDEEIRANASFGSQLEEQAPVEQIAQTQDGDGAGFPTD